MIASVVLVDDIPEVRASVRTALRFGGLFRVVGEAPTGPSGVGLAHRLQPDLVVLGLSGPSLDARRLVSQLSEVAPTTKLVVFTTPDRSDRAWHVAHTAGYVLRDDLGLLVETLRAVALRPDFASTTAALVGELWAVGVARDHVRHHMAAWNIIRLSADAVVIVSELASNAVLHARTEFELELTLHRVGLRIEVTDHGPGQPMLGSPGRSAHAGRGLLIVAALASAWGVDSVAGPHHPGKRVWAELEA